jgi:hypothetical protein
MKHKIDPTQQAQLRLQLELDARIHFVERAHKDVVEMLAQMLLSAARGSATRKATETAMEARDEDR